MLMFLIETVLFVGCIYLIFRFTVKAWKKATVTDKLEKIEEIDKLSKEVGTIDLNAIREKKKKVDEFKNDI